MQVVESIGLQDVGPFKDLTFDIKPGISVIYGLNRAGGPKSKNSNGVGKSFLWSSPADIIYDDPIVGEKSDRIRHGKRIFKFTNSNGKKIVLVREARGKSEKLLVSVDGVDQELRTPTIAKQYLRKVWPITQDEYNTYVHIDSRVPHPLVMGTSAARKAFFTSFFGLNKIDAERKLYAAELKKLSRVRAAYNELRAQFVKSKADLVPASELAELSTKVKSMRRRLDKYREEFTAVQEIVRLVEFEKSAGSQIKTLKAALGEITVEEFQRAVADNRWETKKIVADLADAEAWDQYKRDNKNYEQAEAKLGALTRKAIGKYSLTKARKLAEAKAKSHAEQSMIVKAHEHELRKFVKQSLEPIPPKVKAPVEDESDLKTLKRVYEHHLEHAEKFEDGKCETCGQPVQIKDPALVKKKLDTVIKKLQARADYAEYTEALGRRTELQKWAAEEQQLLDAAKAVEASYARWVVVHEDLVGLPRKPKPFEGKKLQTIVLKRMLEELRERRSLLKYLEPHLDTLVALSNLTDQDRARVVASADLSEKMNSVQDRLSSAQAKIEVGATLSKRVKEMRARLLEMKAELAEEEALQLLLQGYQDKNIKKMVVESIGQRLMAHVNKYSVAIMPEDFRFEFEWGTQVSFLVHRRYGKRTLTSDVRKLSGAESTLFTLVLVCALLAFVPARKRCSLLILDEPSARLSGEMTEVFKKLLSVLNTLIPSIVVVTPKSDEIYEGAKPYTVVKKAGVATIFEGFPHQYTN